MQTARGHTRGKAIVINEVVALAKLNQGIAGRVAESSFLESLEPEDFLIMETFDTLFRADPEGTKRAYSESALADDTNANPLTTLALEYLKGSDPVVSAAVQSLPWIRGGVTPFRDSHGSSIRPSKASLESEVVLAFLDLFLDEREAALALLKSSWVFDGLDNREFAALSYPAVPRPQWNGGAGR